MEFETEEQELDALKKWWKKYGKIVIAGIIIGGGCTKWFCRQPRQRAISIRSKPRLMN